MLFTDKARNYRKLGVNIFGLDSESLLPLLDLVGSSLSLRVRWEQLGGSIVSGNETRCLITSVRWAATLCWRSAVLRASAHLLFTTRGVSTHGVPVFNEEIEISTVLGPHPKPQWLDMAFFFLKFQISTNMPLIQVWNKGAVILVSFSKSTKTSCGKK